MILLDTDHLTILTYEGHFRAIALNVRLQSADDPLITTTVITFEEQMRGWLGEIGRCKALDEQVVVYDRLAMLCRFFGKWPLVSFDLRSAAEFVRLRKARVRIGTPNLKIASIALVHDALLLSANLRDFQKVPGLRVENWLL